MITCNITPNSPFDFNIQTDVTNFQEISDTMSMVYRVQHIEEYVKQLETGHFQPRVRLLEVFYLFTLFFTVFLFILVRSLK